MHWKVALGEEERKLEGEKCRGLHKKMREGEKVFMQFSNCLQLWFSRLVSKARLAHKGRRPLVFPPRFENYIVLSGRMLAEHRSRGEHAKREDPRLAPE